MALGLRITVLLAVLLPFGHSRAAEVCNAGVPGENSAQLDQRFPDLLAACPHAVAMVLFVGMNDAVNDKRFLPPGETEENVTRMLRAAVAAHAIPLLVTVHDPDVVRLMQRHAPQTYGDRPPEVRIADLNRALVRAAARAGAQVVDFQTVLRRAGGANLALSTDGVHLTQTGYRLLAQAVAAQLPLSAQTGKVLCVGDSLTYGTGVRAVGAPDAGSASYPQQLQALLTRGP